TVFLRTDGWCVVENSVTRADRSFSRLEGIPSQPDSWREILGVMTSGFVAKRRVLSADDHAVQWRPSVRNNQARGRIALRSFGRVEEWWIKSSSVVGGGRWLIGSGIAYA